MKKKILLSLAVLFSAGVFTACQNDELDVIEENVVNKNELTLNVTVADKLGFDGDAMTRANAEGWENGDKIHAFFDIASDEDFSVRQIVFTYDKAADKWTATKTGDWELNASGKIDAIHTPKGLSSENKMVAKACYLKDAEGNRVTDYAIYANDMPYTYNSDTKVLTATINLDELVNSVRFVVSGVNDSDWKLKCYDEDNEEVAMLFDTSILGMFSNYDFVNTGYTSMTKMKYTTLTASATTPENTYYCSFYSANTGKAVVQLINGTKTWQKSYSKKLKKNSQVSIKGPANVNADVELNTTDANGWVLVAK